MREALGDSSAPRRFVHAEDVAFNDLELLAGVELDHHEDLTWLGQRPEGLGDLSPPSAARGMSWSNVGFQRS
jgi:hypothetical protein